MATEEIKLKLNIIKDEVQDVELRYLYLNVINTVSRWTVNGLPAVFIAVATAK